MRYLQFLIFITTTFFSFNVSAYEETTHQDFSSNAIAISNVAVEQTLLVDSGLQSFGSNQKFTNPDNPNGQKLTITELIRNGAKFEDNFPRFLHHFYNPIDNTPLTVGTELGFTSPDWALEDIGDVSSASSGSQEYSYKDAMNYFYLALTSQTEEVREEKWGKVFQTLGHVIHHVQDMAQPDHVRNDQHNEATDPSWYERYTNEHKGDAYFINLMSGNTYPIPEFSTAREFWTTQATQRGIADFTNRNFVSKDTIFAVRNGNFDTHSKFPFPEPNNVSPMNIAHSELLGATGQRLCDEIKAQSVITFPNDGCFIDFVSTQVTDSNIGEITENTRAASYSIFDKKLADHNLEPELLREDGIIDIIDRSFTLNKFNFKAAHEYLIPRAVAYSAGLINHFFKAKFEVTIDHVNNQFVIKNLSGSVMHGQFQLLDTSVTGVRSINQTWDIANYEITGLANNAEILVPVPDSSQQSATFMFVYRGQLGEAENLEHVYGYRFDIQNRTAGYHQIQYITNEDISISIKTYSLQQLNLHEYVTNLTAHSGQSAYDITNYHWKMDVPDGICYVEAIGNWSFIDMGNFLDHFVIDRDYRAGDWANGAGTEHQSSTIKFSDAVGLVTPTLEDCTAAPYGHRSVAWSDGWISKYPSEGSRYMGFNLEGSPTSFVYLSTSVDILDAGTCRGATIQDIKSTWVPNSTFLGQESIGAVHEYSDKNAFISDNPKGYLDSYIPQKILDYSCP